MVEWLRIPCLKKRDPYYDEKGYWFDKSVKVSFSRGEYQEETWCDVCPLDTCHLCLGIGWFSETLLGSK